MKSTFWWCCGRIWCQGLLLCALRFAQLRTGFDPETGLTVPNNVPGMLLLALLALCTVMEAALRFRLPKGEASAFFYPGRKETSAAVSGGLLLTAGGLLMLIEMIPVRDVAGSVTGLLAAISGGGVLMLIRHMRSGSEPCVGPILPALFFGTFMCLEVYLPFSSDPVLARFYIPLLAAAAMACAFSQLAGLLRGDGNSRSFVFTADLAVLLCLTALADGTPARMLMYSGSAVLLTVFLFLRYSLPTEEGESAAGH